MMLKPLNPSHPFAGEIRNLKNHLHDMQQKKARMLAQIQNICESIRNDETYMVTIDQKISYLTGYPGEWELPANEEKK